MANWSIRLEVPPAPVYQSLWAIYYLIARRRRPELKFRINHSCVRMHGSRRWHPTRDARETEEASAIFSAGYSPGHSAHRHKDHSYSCNRPFNHEPGQKIWLIIEYEWSTWAFMNNLSMYARFLIHLSMLIWLSIPNKTLKIISKSSSCVQLMVLNVQYNFRICSTFWSMYV